MKRHPFAAVTVAYLAFLMLAGCAALGIPQADTFNKRVVVANSIVESAAGTVDTMLTSGKVSRDEAIAAHTKLGESRLAIEIAREVYATNPGDANNRLDTIITALNALQATLEAKK